MLEIGDLVGHKKIKHLVCGKVLAISKTGTSAEVRWRKEDNPEILYSNKAYYRISSLKKVDRLTQ